MTKKRLNPKYKAAEPSTWHAGAKCEACKVDSTYGDLIPVNVVKLIPETALKLENKFYYVCSSCYKTILANKKSVEMPTCLKDPDRRAELLDRYRRE